MFGSKHIWWLMIDLWDIVKTGSDPQSCKLESKYLRRKNAQALHAIQISCGLEAFSLNKVDQATPALVTFLIREKASSPQEI